MLNRMETGNWLILYKNNSKTPLWKSGMFLNSTSGLRATFPALKEHLLLRFTANTRPHHIWRSTVVDRRAVESCSQKNTQALILSRTFNSIKTTVTYRGTVVMPWILMLLGRSGAAGWACRGNLQLMLWSGVSAWCQCWFTLAWK